MICKGQCVLALCSIFYELRLAFTLYSGKIRCMLFPLFHFADSSMTFTVLCAFQYVIAGMLLLLMMFPLSPEDDPQKLKSCSWKVDEFVHRIVRVTMMLFH